MAELDVAARDGAVASPDQHRLREAAAAVFDAYTRGYATGLGVPAAQFEAALDSLMRLFRRPGMWGASQVLGAEAALKRLAATGVPLAILSNSDGTVEQRLREERLCQVGEGPGVPVAAVVDSAAVGVAKPDPRIFELALAKVGADASAAVHVGDSLAMDVEGALAAGVTPLHMDPFGDCPGGGPPHEHVATLDDVAEWLAG
jgi:putative hydrolase of the HAD superfamily